MIKKICTIYHGDDWHKDTPFSNPEDPTKRSFEEFYTIGTEKYNIKFYRACIKWFDVEKNHFKKAWTFEDGVWKKIEKPVAVDAIFDKVTGKRDHELFELKTKISQKTPMLNHPLFRVITNDKLSQYMLFKKHMPKTILVNNYPELDSAIKKTSSEKIVLKPLHGSGGFGIYIGEKNDIPQKSELEFPMIVQEFIISTKGIPGFSKEEEVSDLRLIYTDHQFVYALSRIAKKGSLFTNFHQGAHAILVPENKIPQNVIEMAQEVKEILSTFPHANYSLDFIFDDSGEAFLVEMNTTPGFDLLHIVGDDATKNKNLSTFIDSMNKITHK